MNCQKIIANMGFQCRDLGDETLRIWSPFTYGNDGQHIGLYVEKTNTGYRVTDNCESLMHASSMGINLTQNKINAVNKSVGFEVLISDGGEIATLVNEVDIGRGVASVLNAALSVSHFESIWGPRAKSESFAKIVATVLEESLGSKVLKNVTVTGASGHQLELPLAIKAGLTLIYVQPIAATEEDGVDWKNVYAGYGRMTDLKNAEIEDTSRMIVLEDAANDDEMQKASMLLSASASIVRYSNLSNWAKKKAA